MRVLLVLVMLLAIVYSVMLGVDVAMFVADAETEPMLSVYMFIDIMGVGACWALARFIQHRIDTAERHHG